MSYYPLTSIPDYYGIDALLTEEHKLIRQSVRDWVESFVMPQIDQAAQNHTDIPGLMKELGKIGGIQGWLSIGATVDRTRFPKGIEDIEADR